jgi:hypothetical protein
MIRTIQVVIIGEDGREETRTLGRAVAIGIKKSLPRLSHNSEFFDGRLILVAVQVISGSSAVFRRRSSASTQLSEVRAP